MLSVRRQDAAKMSERSTTLLQLQAPGSAVCDILDEESDNGLKEVLKLFVIVEPGGFSLPRRFAS